MQSQKKYLDQTKLGTDVGNFRDCYKATALSCHAYEKMIQRSCQWQVRLVAVYMEKSNNNIVLCNDRRIAWGNEAGCESRRKNN